MYRSIIDLRKRLDNLEKEVEELKKANEDLEDQILVLKTLQPNWPMHKKTSISP